jgi:hypothetical protein
MVFIGACGASRAAPPQTVLLRAGVGCKTWWPRLSWERGLAVGACVELHRVTTEVVKIEASIWGR